MCEKSDKESDTVGGCNVSYVRSCQVDMSEMCGSTTGYLGWCTSKVKFDLLFQQVGTLSDMLMRAVVFFIRHFCDFLWRKSICNQNISLPLQGIAYWSLPKWKRSVLTSCVGYIDIGSCVMVHF